MAQGANDKHRTTLGICVALIAATAAVYGRTIGFGFVSFDDDLYVYANRHITGGLSLAGVKWAFTHAHGANWHPLTTISHMLDWSLYGHWAGGHHLTNLLLHAAASVVLFLALRRLTGAVWQSGMIAALFCVHPLHVESVAWISERKDVLSGLFFGLTLWAYASYAEGKAAYWLVAAAFAMGLLCKPMLVTVPLLLLLLDYWPLQRWTTGTQWTTLIVEKLPLFALSAMSCIVTYLVQKNYGAIHERASLLFRLQTVLLAYGNYLLKTIVPLDLAASYPLHREPAALACATCFLAIACISALTLAIARRGGGYAAVGWLWFLGMIAPVSGIILIGDQAMADRYTYLSLTGIFIAVIFTAGAWMQGRAAAVGCTAVAIILMVFAAISFEQVGYWRDSETLWRRVLAVAPDSVLAHVNLAAQLHERDSEGKKEAEMLIEEALRIRPDDALANNNRGLELAEIGDLEGAVRHYRIAIQSQPGFTFAVVNLGVALGGQRRWPEAEAALREAVRLDPEFATAENNLGYALAMQGRWAEAIEHYRRAIDLDPQLALAHANLATALVHIRNAEIRH
jgi:tetratricopeptide (TPR) repeat protein